MSQTPRRRFAARSAFLILLFLVAAISLGTLAWLAREAAPMAIDVAVTHWLQSWREPWLTPLMYAISWPGYGVQAALVPLALRRRFTDVLWVLGTLVAALANALVKLQIARPRPSADLVEVFFQMSDYSFPSGHVTQYTSLFGFAFFLAYVLMPRSPRRTAVLILSALPIALIGLSRMYLGQHWLSDVLGGYALGTMLLIPYCVAYGRSRLTPGQPVQDQVGREP